MYGLNSLIKMAVTLAIIALASHNVGPIITALRTAQIELIARPLPTFGASQWPNISATIKPKG
jgi:hypothetical protein